MVEIVRQWLWERFKHLINPHSQWTSKVRVNCSIGLWSPAIWCSLSSSCWVKQMWRSFNHLEKSNSRMSLSSNVSVVSPTLIQASAMPVGLTLSSCLVRWMKWSVVVCVLQVLLQLLLWMTAAAGTTRMMIALTWISLSYTCCFTVARAGFAEAKIHWCKNSLIQQSRYYSLRLIIHLLLFILPAYFCSIKINGNE